MASVTFEKDFLDINLSWLDQALAFHGSFQIPWTHVTNAYVAGFEDRELQYKLAGTNFGYLKTAGVFANSAGIIFCDVTGGRDCLVVETRGERFPRIAVQLPDGEDTNAVAHRITSLIPDGGAVD
jgi:hypothetical protein